MRITLCIENRDYATYPTGDNDSFLGFDCFFPAGSGSDDCSADSPLC
jgi:hypothetical protein